MQGETPGSLDLVELYKKYKQDAARQCELHTAYLSDINHAHREKFGCTDSRDKWPEYLKKTYQRYCDHCKVVCSQINVICSILNESIFLLPNGNYLVPIMNDEYGNRLEEREVYGALCT